MPHYKFGDIVLMRFHPAYGQELKKYRPSIITKDLSKIDNRFIQIAPLSSRFTKSTKSSNRIKPNNDHELVIKHPALDKPSLLLAWYIMTFDATRVIHKLGEINLKDAKRIKRIINRGV